MANRLFQYYRAVLLYDQEEEYADALQALTDHLAANPSNAAAYGV